MIAGDLTWRRVKLRFETCQKQNADLVNIVQYDAAEALPFGDEQFDRVLVDAPCTGTGTIRHNPEIRYFVSPDDFPAWKKPNLRYWAMFQDWLEPVEFWFIQHAHSKGKRMKMFVRNFCPVSLGGSEKNPQFLRYFGHAKGLLERIHIGMVWMAFLLQRFNAVSHKASNCRYLPKMLDFPVDFEVLLWEL